MKKLNIIFTVIACIVINTILLAQDFIIKIPVTLSQNYLLLEPDVDVDYWEIEIIDRTVFEDGRTADEVIEVVELKGKDYYKISSEYKNNPNAFVNVREYRYDGEILEEIQKLNATPCAVYGQGPAEYMGNWNCNGSTYAWKIQQIGTTYNGYVTKSYFNVVAGVDKIIQGNPTQVVPYYQYFSPAQFEQFKTSLFGTTNRNINGVHYTQYYQVGNQLLLGYYNGINQNPGDMISVVKLQYDSQNIKKDKDGSDITGVDYVYGIAKGLGPWGGYCSVSAANWGTTNFYTYTSFQGINTIQWAMNLINSNSQSNPNNCNKPDLTCSSAGGQGPSQGENHEVEEDITVEMDKIVWLSDLIGTVDDVYNPEDLSFLDNYHAISLTKISGISSEVINMKFSDIINEQGEIIDIPINLQEGVYSIGIQFDNGDYIAHICERTISTNPESTDLSNFLTTSIYPVPIIEDEFKIGLSATIEMWVQYKLYDFSMNLIYETEINIVENESVSIHIKPEEPIPSGVLVNQFIFEDGSQSSVLSLK